MKFFGYAVAVGLMSLYLVFIVAKMSRSDGADQNALVLAAALGVGALVGVLALAWPRGGRR